MPRLAGVVGFLWIALVAMLVSAPAYAQATRTWVSGVGDDVNPCSRTAPCKTFAGAISKTAAGGIINCIDSGGFGALTITKSITIDCSTVIAGVLAVGTNGINVSAGASDNVTLRGLSIEGGNGAGLVGVNYNSGGTVHIERCRIFGFRTGNASGIRFGVPAGIGAELIVSDTTIVDSGSGAATGGGIVVAGTGSVSVRVTLSRVQLSNNSAGLNINGTAGSVGGVITLILRDSMTNANNGAGVTASAGTGAVLTAVLDNVSTIANATGVSAVGAQARILMTRTTAIANNVGLNASEGGVIFSYGDSHINNNFSSNGTPSPVAPQ